LSFLFCLQITDSRLLDKEEKILYELIIFGKLCDVYNCQLITNNAVPSIHGPDKICDDEKTFEEYFQQILQTSTRKGKGVKWKKTLTGDYIFDRNKITILSQKARGLLLKKY